MFGQTQAIAEIPSVIAFETRKPKSIAAIETAEQSLPALYLSYHYFKYSTNADAKEQRFFQQLTELIERNHRKILYYCAFSAPFSSEAYRQARLFYDDLVALVEHLDELSDAELLQSPPHFRAYAEALQAHNLAAHDCMAHLKKCFAKLDEPTEAYQSVFFRKLSEKEVWGSRCKAYKYII